jgi:hypothetical protein
VREAVRGANHPDRVPARARADATGSCWWARGGNRHDPTNEEEQKTRNEVSIRERGTALNHPKHRMTYTASGAGTEVDEPAARTFWSVCQVQ